MKRVFQIGAVAVLGLAGIGVWKGEELVRLQAVNTLFSEEKIVSNFSQMDQLFETRAIAAGAPPVTFETASQMALPGDWQNWLERRAVTGIVVLRDGQIVHEDYHKGTKDTDLRISWSVAKSYLSSLFGILLAKGDVDSIDDPVTKYAPELIGSAYDGATIRNVLQMSSGVEFDEDYLDFWSDINKMGRVLALGASMDGFAAGLSGTVGAPGEQWAYVSIDTHVLSMVLRGATGRSIPDLVGEHLFQPLGANGAPYYVTDGYGVAFVLGGLNLTTRDYARLGQLFLQNGQWNGMQVVPADWVAESTQPSAPTAPGKIQYGYQWWIPADARPGEFLARGVYGQYVYVNRPAGLVVAVNGADRAFREPGAFDDSLSMFRKLADNAQVDGA
ncbi:MAG: serine hydrolase [Paracoccaceae bacterium]|nr:serine hydrolase [Paracoccaceae bacterium]